MKLDRTKVILRMRRVSQNLLKAYKWIALEILSVKGPTKEVVFFTEDLEVVLKKHGIDKR